MISYPGLVVRENAPLAARTTLRIGGAARWLCEAHDVKALQAVLAHASAEGLPLLPLGKGSNILVPDEGFPGVALVMAGELARVAIDGPRVRAGGGASLMSLSVLARDAGLSGLEGLSGIPSSFGGAVRINAGAYGSELFDVLESVELVTRAGVLRVCPAAEVAHGYRWTSLMEGDDLVTGGTMVLVPKPAEEIDERLREVTEKRRNALPKQPNAGSIFKNPPGRHAGRLLQECGLKGRRVGGAEVSAVHANVIVNRGGASAADVRALMSMMREAVLARFGVELIPEVEVIGSPSRSVESPG